MHYTLPQSIYRNKNLSWPKITINILKKIMTTSINI